MSNWTSPLASLALLAAFTDQAPAQSRAAADAIKTISRSLPRLRRASA
jgi:hypothetical protein